MPAPSSVVSAPASTPVPLTEATLCELPADVAVFEYDRSSISPGVVHIGVGGFHRAHQAVYFDDLAGLGFGDWGVTGVGLHRPEMGEVLWSQECLYLLNERGRETETARVIGIIGRYLHGATQPEAVFEVLADPATRLVTLTITGDGYDLDADCRFRPDCPTVLHDLAHPDRPESAYAFLVEGLRRRRAAGIAPFTVLSCDNIPKNGLAARAMVVGYAELCDPELARWIDEHVAFPSSMVDRITPDTTPSARDAIAASTGVDDRWPVITEAFSQWIVEDEFCNERPPLELVGVHFVPDVGPYQLTKKRLLNGAHSAIGYLGTLAGHATTAEVMADPVLAAYVDALVDEIVPLLPAAPGLDLDDYKASLLDRLANPRVGDQLSRLCRRGSTKMPAYLLPSIEDAIAAGQPRPMLTLAVAGWLRYLAGEDDAGRPIVVEDAHADRLTALARTMGDDVGRVLADRTIFGDLADATDFVSELRAACRALADGVVPALGARFSMTAAA